MVDLYGEDFRDLNDPENFVNRSAEERRLALIYFLKVGSVDSYNLRVSIARRADPQFVPDLHAADLTNTSLWKINLSRANLREAQFEWADMRDANLAGADLTCANLVGADLRGANLGGAILDKADLRGAIMTATYVENVDFSTVKQGHIPPDLMRENPNVRTPAPPPRSKERDVGPPPGSLAEGLSSANYMGPKRDYTGGQKKGGAEGPSLAEQAEKEKEEASKKKKEDLKKFQKKKKQTEKFFSKKKTDQKKFEEKKKQNEMAYRRKQEESKKKK